ncbi:hypothetical protein O3G_MSEX003799 [Manduca sexta]|uniref:BPTI/Kunitz inhibitor domain-containing protein n=1 Tax=Manduca sexta TaxID=7130 RepID=A0A922CGD8_MANSE|nr:hypothetical protein O3G_MSEX003799 [Manduca sexta]KAG6445192.1 hypothetical protein O3G_MSEX003799 [Manduca sexta]
MRVLCLILFASFMCACARKEVATASIFKSCSQFCLQNAHVVKVREERCLRPILRGECTDYHTRYAYDPAVNKCVRFKYGGCGGSPNQFLHHHECRRACII